MLIASQFPSQPEVTSVAKKRRKTCVLRDGFDLLWAVRRKRTGCPYSLTTLNSASGFDSSARMLGEVMARYFT